MYKGKTFLAIIPARSGSKGLKDKNIRDLCGKPLLAYSIEAALKTNIVDAVVLSTDNKKYAEIGRKYGAEVPFIRPQELSGDESPVAECIVHTINELNALERKYDYFILLQPTSPLRTAEHIVAGIHMMSNDNLDSVVAFSKAEHPVEYYHCLPKDMRLDNLVINSTNRQEYDTYYRINGMLYISKCEKYLKTRSFYGRNSKALLIDTRYAIDIDCEQDFAFAEFLMKRSMFI